MSIKEDGWVDVSPTHDGSLVKKIISKGCGLHLPINAHAVGMLLCYCFFSVSCFCFIVYRLSPTLDGSMVKKIISKGCGLHLPLNAHAIGMLLFY
jgi:hypothetical protein